MPQLSHVHLHILYSRRRVTSVLNRKLKQCLRVVLSLVLAEDHLDQVALEDQVLPAETIIAALLRTRFILQAVINVLRRKRKPLLQGAR